MNSDEAELAAATIQRLNQYAEGLCQQLQDARATIALMSDAALVREREISRLREALEAAESKCSTVSMPNLMERCLICDMQWRMNKPTKHAAYCPFAALKGTADATD